MTNHYLLIGAGGTGSILFPTLTHYLEAHHRNADSTFTLTVIDGDTVAPSNLDRQIFAARYVGENKAAALLSHHSASPTNYRAVQEYLGSKNIHGIHEHDIVIIAVDNFTVRAKIEKHCEKLDNITVINAGNENSNGSLQIWLRRNGVNVTPPMSHTHPEIKVKRGEDRATMSCQQVAELPGGGQTIVANMMSATLILNALHKIHALDNENDVLNHNEVFFDLSTNAMRGTNR